MVYPIGIDIDPADPHHVTVSIGHQDRGTCTDTACAALRADVGVHIHIFISLALLLTSFLNGRVCVFPSCGVIVCGMCGSMMMADIFLVKFNIQALVKSLDMVQRCTPLAPGEEEC